jgi:hypothetical protein
VVAGIDRKGDCTLAAACWLCRTARSACRRLVLATRDKERLLLDAFARALPTSVLRHAKDDEAGAFDCYQRFEPRKCGRIIRPLHRLNHSVFIGTATLPGSVPKHPILLSMELLVIFRRAGLPADEQVARDGADAMRVAIAMLRARITLDP